MEIHQKKIWPLASRLSRSLKVIGTDTDRSATYDFILVICSNYEPIARTVSEINGDLDRKSQISPHSRVFNVPADGVALEIL